VLISIIVYKKLKYSKASHYRNTNHLNCSHYLLTVYMQHLLGLILFLKCKIDYEV